MRQNECGRFRCAVGATVGKLALTILVVLIVASSASGAPKDKEQEFTRVYEHTYDEVFQASQEAIERMGLYVTAKDKDKGTISGEGIFYQGMGKKCIFDIHIEALNTKPETQVTVHAKVKGVLMGWEPELKRKILMELQQVLATYH
jgi:hypothetical protein